MILTEEYLQDLLDKTLTQVRTGDWAVVLEGSIAEGFGNPGSDIDFLLIGRDEDDLPTMPSLFFVDGRRVEIRTRSLRQLTEQFAALETGAKRVGRIPEDLLNRCQRLLNSVPLRGHALVDEVKSLLPAERLGSIAAAWWAHSARQSLRHATAMMCLDEPEEAMDWARAGLVQAVKAWAAGRGETYLEPKWLSLQLDRADRPDVRDRYWELESAGPDVAADDYLGACVEFAAELGVTGVQRDPARLTVERQKGVTTWQTSERVHVVRGRRDVFVLGERAGQVWRSLVLGTPLPRVLANARATGAAEAGPLLAHFLRLGLVRLAWKGGGTVAPALPLASPPGPLTPPPGTARPLLSLRGAAVSGPDAVDLVPLPADRFAAAALALAFSNMVVENAREDLAGALRQGQWKVAEVSARRAAQSALRGLLCAYGVSPLPADCDLVRRLSLLPPGIQSIRTLANTLSRVSIDSPERAEAVLRELEQFIGLVRQAAGADAFPASFDSADTWRATLELGHDWVRVAAHFDAELPLQEVRDLVASSGAQPHQAA
ncbi:nucleotidyltransferase domain-containing protein [Streptomyces sp. NRRL S-646]|uniref:nucleotidyltransferase domain-containing protein n=1 Tax=Streptomyces sp. NRRL S-646 TaxID=1463917 RepID=UPI0004C5E0F4|nr:nucleotidyltransferase domain-containing protein [Streptomyces sp. NRRL S-646]